MKKIVPLNDDWLFGVGFKRDWLDADFDFDGFYPVELPHNAATPVESPYFQPQSVYTYTRLLEPDLRYDDSKLELCFGGVTSYAEVYINGLFVTSHKGDTPFSVDISAPIKIGQKNRIVLKVDGSEEKDAPLTCGKNPLVPCAGIHGGVSLKVVAGGEIADVFVMTNSSAETDADSEKGEEGGERNDIELKVTLEDYYPDSVLSAQIVDDGGRTVCVLPAKSVLSKEVSLVGRVGEVKKWSVNDPVLYTAVVTLKYGEYVMDTEFVPFGFRTCEFKRDGFYLNGERLKLIGLNRLDFYPIIGRAATRELQRYDVRRLKELGCNVVRTQGLAGRAFIEECDRAGLLVISDMSGDGYVGGAAWKDAFVSAVEACVKRDRNSPSVIAWGVRVGNSADQDELYFKTSKAARDNDPTRMTLGARNFMGSRMYEDVFAYNDYGKLGKVTPPRKTARLSVPFLISEHTGKLLPTKRFDSLSRRNAQAAAHIAVIDKVMRRRNTIGAIGMAMTDFFCRAECGSGNARAYYGVLDCYRTDKTAAYAYRSQRDDRPYLKAEGAPFADESCGKLVIYTNCESVKLYRDDELVGEFFPDFERYKGIKHPPIEIDDFIGDLPMTTENLSRLQNRIFKAIAARVKKSGSAKILPLWAKIALRLLAKAAGTDLKTAEKIVERYALAPSAYRAEGIIGGQVATESRITPQTSRLRIRLEASSSEVRPSDTYETVLVTACLTDDAGNVADYDFSPITVRVSGAMRLIGDEILSLEGGAVGFFLVTTPYDGEARVEVSSKYGEETLTLEVIHERVETL